MHEVRGEVSLRRLNGLSDQEFLGVRRRIWFSFALPALLLIAIAVDHCAYQGWFHSDDLDTLSWASFGSAEYYLRTWFSPFYHRSTFRPVGHLIYHTLSQRFGLDFSYYVATIQLLHLINITLLWRLLRKLGFAELPALVALIFFAFHPATFLVRWRPMYVFELTCATFSLLSLLMWLRRQWVLSFLFFATAYRAKEIAILLPAILLAYEWWLGERRWKPLIPFLLWSASFGFQAAWANRGTDDQYTLRPTPAVFWQCLQYYSQRFLLPLSLAVLPFAAILSPDRRICWGVTAFFLWLGPMLLLPAKLQGAYLYLPLLGASVAMAALASSRRAQAILIPALLCWLPFALLYPHREEEKERQAGLVNRDYVNTLASVVRENPEMRRFAYAGRPPSLEHWGITGALAYHIQLAGGHSVDLAVDAMEGVNLTTFANQIPSAMLIWNPDSRKLSVRKHTASGEYLSYLTMDRTLPVWQIGRGWRDPESDGRWIEGHAEARIARPAGASQFVLQALVKHPIDPVVSHEVSVRLGGQRLETKPFGLHGNVEFSWPLPPGSAGITEVSIDVRPESFWGEVPRSYSLKIQALGFR